MPTQVLSPLQQQLIAKSSVPRASSLFRQRPATGRQQPKSSRSQSMILTSSMSHSQPTPTQPRTTLMRTSQSDNCRYHSQRIRSRRNEQHDHLLADQQPRWPVHDRCQHRRSDNAAAINREVHGATRTITVQATSSDGSAATQDFTITINDLDEFDVSTPTDLNAAANEIDENTAIGTAVGITANAFDLDSTTNTITYSLTSNPDGLFTIDANTGVVTTARPSIAKSTARREPSPFKPRPATDRQQRKTSPSRSMISTNSTYRYRRQ